MKKDLQKRLSKLLGSKPIIVGYGKSHQSLTKWLQELDIPIPVICDDCNPKMPRPSEEFLKSQKPTSLIVSPGVPLKRFWPLAQQLKIPIFNELDLASISLTSEQVCGITGSAGKSTTAALIAHGLKKLGYRVFLGGNFGTPLSEYALNLIRNISKAEFVVLEISSYQLESLRILQLDWSFITSLIPNHLDRYDNFQDYAITKFSIWWLTQKKLFINTRNPIISEFYESLQKEPEAWAQNAVHQVHSPIIQEKLLSPIPKSKIVSVQGYLEYPQFPFSRLQIIGQHNWDNIALVNKFFETLNVDEQTRHELWTDFQGLPHRLQFIGSINNVKFFNDSKSTTVESIIESLNTILPSVTGSLHLLVGGKDKNLNWSALSDYRVNTKIKWYFFGESRFVVREKTQIEAKMFPSLKDLLKELPQYLDPGDLVLLSPGGSSLDEFGSFEERGNYFTQWVQSQNPNKPS